ncbi:MAG: ASCH domain-containing protein [Nostoc sp.]
MTILSIDCPKGLRAMTCHAPFAYALALGEKPEEYRYRATNYRGWVFFHSGLSKASDFAFEYLNMEAKDAERGAIIGAGYLNSCSKSGNCFAYEFINPVLFEKALKIRGKQQILWLPADSNGVQIFASAWQILRMMYSYCLVISMAF